MRGRSSTGVPITTEAGSCAGREPCWDSSTSGKYNEKKRSQIVISCIPVLLETLGVGVSILRSGLMTLDACRRTENGGKVAA